MKLLGLMSGTSLDGLDVALLEVEGTRPPGLKWELLEYRTRPFSHRERRLLREALSGGVREVARAHSALGHWSVREVLDLLDEMGVSPEGVAAIGSHGQTLWHHPPGAGEEESYPVSFQVGDPAVLAEGTGIAVVSDFRARDVAAGGHGAPLVPWPDRVFFSRPGVARVLQNLGGMGNLTWLPPAGSLDPLVAFDTGPGVVLLDEAASLASGGRDSMDGGGERALRGRVRPAWVEDLLELPFFRQAPPRTTGRELFNGILLRDLLHRWEAGGDAEGWDDVLATLSDVTARCAVEAMDRWVRPRAVDEVILTGGGARNPALVRAFQQHLGAVPVRTGAEALGMDPDAREAAAFALLAWAHLQGIPGNAPEATGARGPRILGTLTPGGHR